MPKMYKMNDYLKSIDKKNNKEEDEFLIAQVKIHKNLSKDIMCLVNSLESDGMPAPKDLVFVTYFAMFWDKMMSMYKDEQEKKDVIDIFNNVMLDKAKNLKHESLN